MERPGNNSKKTVIPEFPNTDEDEEESRPFNYNSFGCCNLRLSRSALAKLTPQEILELPSTSASHSVGCKPLPIVDLGLNSLPSTSRGPTESNFALAPSRFDKVDVPKSISQVRECTSDLLRSISDNAQLNISHRPSERSVLSLATSKAEAESSKSCSGAGVSTSSDEGLQFIIDDDVSLGSSNSTTATNEDFCRICHELDQDEILISPCKCKGSLSLVHTSCLQHWLAESDSSHCELCGFKYKTRRKPKYSMFGSVIAWFKSCRRERREVILDILATITFAPMAGIGTYIGLLMAEALNLDDDLPNITMGTLTGRVAALSIISLMTTLDVAYATWAAIRIQYHINSWYSWYRRNSDVTLIESAAGISAK